MAAGGEKEKRIQQVTVSMAVDLASCLSRGAEKDPAVRLLSLAVAQLREWIEDPGLRQEPFRWDHLFDPRPAQVSAQNCTLHAASVRLEHQGPGPFWRLALEAFLLPPWPGEALVRRRAEWLYERGDLPPAFLERLVESNGRPVEIDMTGLIVMVTALVQGTLESLAI